MTNHGESFGKGFGQRRGRTGKTRGQELFRLQHERVQSLWMAVFVQWFVRFPGDFTTQALMLVLINGATTFICLGLSSLLRTPEQASLVSIYLVGFQLPLSGAILALRRSSSS